MVQRGTCNDIAVVGDDNTSLEVVTSRIGSDYD